MALESATYISQLVPANPPASDPIAQSANHLNLIKTVLQGTFPNANTPLAATMENLNNGTPVGLIAMWSGSSLPAGWTLCNGVAVARMDGTGNITPPDLRDRFIVGAGLSYGEGATGGVAVYELSAAQLPSHTHAASSDSQGSHVHGGSTNAAGGHQHTLPNQGSVQAGSDNGGAMSPVGTGYSSSRTQSPTDSVGDHTHPFITDAGGVHSHNITVQATGSGAPIENRPPFYALAFIMKV